MEEAVIYVDILFAVNFLINLILLFASGRMARVKIKKLRLIIGAALGAVYSVCMFFPQFAFGYTLLCKLLFSLGLVAVTFDIHNLKLYLKVLGIFYVVSFSFGGCAFALFCFPGVGSAVGAVMSNGVIYFNLPWHILLLSVFISYMITVVVWRMYQSRVSKDNLYAVVRILQSDNVVEFKALIDTGNMLCDPLTSSPVIVAEYNKVRPILPSEARMIFDTRRENDLELVANVLSSAKERLNFRMIPFSSLGMENGMLIGFKPQQVSVVHNENERTVGDAIIGIYNKALSKDRSYFGLMSPQIID